MKVYDLKIPSNRGLTNIELIDYIKKLNIRDCRGVFMRNALPQEPKDKECGIVNFNKSSEPGSHWVCYYKNGDRRIYFDSFGQATLEEIQKYLKTKKEFEQDRNVIQRNTDIVQHINTDVCGHLCLYVLTALTREHLSYQETLNLLNNGYSQGAW